MIYHMCQQDEYDDAKQLGFCQPADYAKDGFIHFSTLEQICATAEKHYNGAKDLVLFEVDETLKPGRYIFENTSGGTELFPHLYSLLPMSEVIRVIPFPPNADGSYSIPPELQA